MRSPRCVIPAVSGSSNASRGGWSQKKCNPGITEIKLHELHVYGEQFPSHPGSVAWFLMFVRTGKGDFVKPRKHMPRDESMVGSLVVVLPTRHEGGQLVIAGNTPSRKSGRSTLHTRLPHQPSRWHGLSPSSAPSSTKSCPSPRAMR
ncbi:hypothetical protein HD554DRAFT_1250070 [Boletus coccyginus]|nr:hypothetical protein HD554DRAFT_1250070 [Boletus coccyginus]